MDGGEVTHTIVRSYDYIIIVVNYQLDWNVGGATAARRRRHNVKPGALRIFYYYRITNKNVVDIHLY